MDNSSPITPISPEPREPQIGTYPSWKYDPEILRILSFKSVPYYPQNVDPAWHNKYRGKHHYKPISIDDQDRAYIETYSPEDYIPSEGAEGTLYWAPEIISDESGIQKSIRVSFFHMS